jgi:hypothetical protein
MNTVRKKKWRPFPKQYLYFIFIDLVRMLGADFKDLTTVEQMEKIKKLCTMVRQFNATHKNNAENWIFLFQLGEVPDFIGELFMPAAAAANLSPIPEKQLPTTDKMKIMVREWTRDHHPQLHPNCNVKSLHREGTVYIRVQNIKLRASHR